MNIKRCASRPTDSTSAHSTDLEPQAEQLLAALEPDGAYAFPDPTNPDGLIVRSGGDGISLGGGRHRSKAGDALLQAGLAEQSNEKRQHIAITAAGRARLQRKRWPGENAWRAQHLALIEGEDGGAREPTLRDASESPLAWMARRRGRDGRPLIDSAAFAAGERLRSDLTLAAMLPSVSTDWGRPKVDGGGARDPVSGTDARLSARIRVDRALASVGADLSGLLIDLCGFLKGLERIESERNWPARSGKVVARIALARLAEHYGIDNEAVGPDRVRSRLWRA